MGANRIILVESYLLDIELPENSSDIILKNSYTDETLTLKGYQNNEMCETLTIMFNEYDLYRIDLENAAFVLIPDEDTASDYVSCY